VNIFHKFQIPKAHHPNEEKNKKNNLHFSSLQTGYHKVIQAQYIKQWSRVLRSGGPNHSKLLCVLTFFPFSN
jgi:hypothetical protein